MMSLLEISVRLIGSGWHRQSVLQMFRVASVVVCGTLLVLGSEFPSSSTAGVLDRLRRRKPSTAASVATIPTVAGFSRVVNTFHHESADVGETGPTCTTCSSCSNGDCEPAGDVGFWRRMANRMTDHKRRWRRKMYFEYHFSNKKMLYPVCPPFGTANYGYFPTCWRQFPETCHYCPPRQLNELPSAGTAGQPPSSSPRPIPVPPPSPKHPVPAPPSGK